MTIGSTLAVIHGFAIVFRSTKSLCIIYETPNLSHLVGSWLQVAEMEFCLSAGARKVWCSVQADICVGYFLRGLKCILAA